MRYFKLLVKLAGIGALAGAWAGPAAAIPPGFSDTLVAGVSSPTALAFTPDGRLLVTSQGGVLSIVQNGMLLSTPALTFPTSGICSDVERGLLGVAVSPGFASNQHIFLYYTFKTPSTTCVNRVSRFTLPNTNVIDPASELVLIDNMPSTAGNHNAGDLLFGKDGFLYATIGDGGCDYAGGGCGGQNEGSRNQQELTGKLLRITEDGGIPASNPFQGAGTARCNVTGGTIAGNKCQETFAWGFRNPFRFSADPNAPDTRIFVNDVGQAAWEEIDLIQAGADYGWNCREGAHTNSTSGLCNPTPPGMVDPIFEYAHNTTIPGTTSPASCNCITGAAFVPNGLWPGFDGAYLFGDCVCGGIFRLDQTGSTYAAGDFAIGLGTVVHLAFGPFGNSQALYYTTNASGGQVRRISAPPPAAPTQYFTVTPCRLVDTRQAAGPTGGPALAGGASRSFVATGACGVPAGATAVALNLTVTNPTAAGSLTVYPAGMTVPATSTLNFSGGQTRANNGLTQLGPAGDLAILCAMPAGSTADVIVDLVGYFQ
jgi:glucose/arabinose dehydrogenase